MSDSKMCPREPTEDMVGAARKCYLRLNDPQPPFIAKLWRTMFDAAPPQADAEALLRALIDAGSRIDAAAKADAERGVLQMTGRGDVMRSREWEAARAYLAVKDAP